VRAFVQMTDPGVSSGPGHERQCSGSAESSFIHLGGAFSRTSRSRLISFRASSLNSQVPDLPHPSLAFRRSIYRRCRHNPDIPVRALALRPQYGDLSGSRRDLGDILVVDGGTVGLVLSTPLTVCLVVLGRHVERLAFLDVIFGDTPPLTPVENFYQRMLAGDASEVSDQAEQFLKTNSLVNYYDEVVLQSGFADGTGGTSRWPNSSIILLTAFLQKSSFETSPEIVRQRRPSASTNFAVSAASSASSR
jgi:hypothetical protein